MSDEPSTIHCITLDETPTRWRLMCDDGQIVEVVGYDTTAIREAALSYFEANTDRPKPQRESEVWVRIEGVSRLARFAVQVEGEGSPRKPKKATEV